MSDAVRIDRWLWTVRLYKTRSEAAAACRGNRVRVGGDAVKPSRDVRPGDIVTTRHETITRTVRVRGMPRQRVGASVVAEYLEDLTPPEERAAAQARAVLPPPLSRPPGSGRPTKRERRLLDSWLGEA